MVLVEVPGPVELVAVLVLLGELVGLVVVGLVVVLLLVLVLDVVEDGLVLERVVVELEHEAEASSLTVLAP